MNLVDEWRQAWKWLQVQLGVVVAAAALLYGQVDFLQDLIGPKWYGVINALLGLAVIYNALRKKAQQ
jgi:hypothetical protein